jgi:hypothetical protein
MNITKISRFLLSLFDVQSCLFKFSEKSNTTLLSTDFAMLTMFLLGKSDEIINLNILKTISEYKTNIDTFTDKLYDPNIERFHKPDYIINQSTFFTLIALDQLGHTFNKLNFLEDYLNPNNVHGWFKSLNWSAFWYESNNIMFKLYFYTYAIKYSNENDKQKAQECIELAFEILNKKQDRNTGFWGTDLNNNNVIDGCFGAAHIYLFYDFFGKEIQYKEKIIDNTLSLHSSNGLLLTNEGGACEDYDAVEIYLRLLNQTDYRKKDIINRIEQISDVIKRNQEPDGGFPYRISKKKFGFFKQKKEDIYRYSSWELMEARLYYSDTWATYFRLLTIAAIDQILSKQNKWFQSYSLPGWGHVVNN